jgi:hypothetical protein
MPPSNASANIIANLADRWAEASPPIATPLLQKFASLTRTSYNVNAAFIKQTTPLPRVHSRGDSSRNRQPANVRRLGEYALYFLQLAGKERSQSVVQHTTR